MAKYKMLRDTVLGFPNLDLVEAPSASDSEILLAHDPSYLQAVINGSLSEAQQKEIGFPWSAKMVERSRRSAGATIAACKAALVDGIAANLAGGTHHAYRHKGSGFCVFNDAAIAARVLLKDPMAKAKNLSKIAILDLDVHQGDGTASILQHDPAVGEKNYPFAKEASDLDIALPDGTTDPAYLQALDQALSYLSEQEIDFLIYLAGADPYYEDRLGRLQISQEGMAARDRAVLEFASKKGIAVALAMAGGYANPIKKTVLIHAQTIRLATEHQHTIASSLLKR
ncbi:MAG: histone deacetylase [Burkholderiaceae bacterium]|nr:histone deacetylase [Burkholderiaceae bacterium]